VKRKYKKDQLIPRAPTQSDRCLKPLGLPTQSDRCLKPLGHPSVAHLMVERAADRKRRLKSGNPIASQDPNPVGLNQSQAAFRT
jgi:hypothetical protein